MTKGMHKTKSGRMAKKGLWYNIHQKEKRRKAKKTQGIRERPTAAAFREVKKQ